MATGITESMIAKAISGLTGKARDMVVPVATALDAYTGGGTRPHGLSDKELVSITHRAAAHAAKEGSTAETLQSFILGEFDRTHIDKYTGAVDSALRTSPNAAKISEEMRGVITQAVKDGTIAQYTPEKLATIAQNKAVWDHNYNLHIDTLTQTKYDALKDAHVKATPNVEFTLDRAELRNQVIAEQGNFRGWDPVKGANGELSFRAVSEGTTYDKNALNKALADSTKGEVAQAHNLSWAQKVRHGTVNTYTNLSKNVSDVWKSGTTGQRLVFGGVAAVGTGALIYGIKNAVAPKKDHEGHNVDSGMMRLTKSLGGLAIAGASVYAMSRPGMRNLFAETAAKGATVG